MEVHGQLVRAAEAGDQGLHLAGVATPMVSPRESWEQPMSSRRRPTVTTWSGATTPSQGSPKHIER
ncbi:hypothetical protein GCM10029964_112110 [Kibdelosporangium lantanae]